MSSNPVADMLNSPEAVDRVVAFRNASRGTPPVDTLAGEELGKVVDFENEHDRLHGCYAGAIGGRYALTFVQTSIGTVISIKCAHCKKELDVTDYEGW